MFSSGFELFPEDYRKNQKVIIDLFRNGIMHQFFPKSSGIGKCGSNISLVFEQNDIPNLNVDRLSEDIKTAIIELRRKIESGSYDLLAKRINDRLDHLKKKEDENKKMKENINVS